MVNDNSTEVVQAWNAIAERLGLSKIKLLTTARSTQLRARLRTVGLEAVLEALGHIHRSTFLRGERANSEHPNWRCTFDFFVSERGFTRIMEGQYDDESSVVPERPAPSGPPPTLDPSTLGLDDLD